MTEADAAAPETVTDLFGRDHRRLDALLADAKRALAAGEPARATPLFTAFREGLERHIVAEEEILFPAFEELTGVTAGPTRVMCAEHVDIRKLLGEIASRLEQGSEGGYTTPLASLTALLYAHNGKEERILYPATDRAASSAGTLEALVAKIVL
ncbi:MAG: hemerythrin domain-containing protein [Deltaproteobacteria bacterium]|nr:hemerythrin domain-containing protein [Deltaproteobacteria bacterium]